MSTAGMPLPAHAAIDRRPAARARAAADRGVARVDALLTWKRVHRYPLIGLAVLLVSYGIDIAIGHWPFDAFGHPLAVDLTAHVTGGQIVASGDSQRLYDFTYQWQVQQRLLGPGHPEFFDVYLSPPFVAYLYAPFASIPYLAAAAIWTLLTIALVVGSFRLLWPLVPGLHRFGFWFVLALVFSTYPVLDLILDGQDSAISLLLLVLGLRLLLSRRDAMAGVVLGLGTFKPQIFVLLPVLLLCQRRWQALAATLATTLGLAALSVALMGPRGTQSYVATFSSGTYATAVVSDFGWKMQSFIALAGALFPGPLRFLVIPTTAAVVVLFVGLLVRTALRPARTNRAFCLLYALAVITSGIINPHFFIYDCSVLVLPFLILFDDAPTRPIVRVPLAVAYAVTWTVPIRYLLLGHAPWPISLLAAPWTVVPLMALALFLVRQLPENREVPAGRPGAEVVPQVGDSARSSISQA